MYIINYNKFSLVIINIKPPGLRQNDFYAHVYSEAELDEVLSGLDIGPLDRQRAKNAVKNGGAIRQE
jgi:hypothetical protein